MIDLNTLLTMWAQDAVIVSTGLDEASRTTPELHAKYLRLWVESKLNAKKAERERAVLVKNKWLYYSGKMDRDRIEELGWEPDPFEGLRVMKGDLEHYYNTDTELADAEAKAEYWKTMIDTIGEIMGSVKWRHQTIKNMISNRVFEAGG